MRIPGGGKSRHSEANCAERHFRITYHISVKISPGAQQSGSSRAILGDQNGLQVHLKFRLMRRNHLFAGILLLALFMSAWGQVLAAASCPHMRQGHSCCHARVAHSQAADEMSGDMRMTPAAEAAPSAEVEASDKPVEECDHCMGRASQPPPTATLRDVDRTDRGSELAAPVVLSQSHVLALPRITPSPSREHSPPGSSVHRHVLISVFRV